MLENWSPEEADYLKRLAEKANLDFDTVAEAVMERMRDPEFARGMEQKQKEEQLRRARYLQMDAAELAQLEDEALCDAVCLRLEQTEEAEQEAAVFLASWDYLQEMENGGLCQYFVNNWYRDVSVLPEALDIIGAGEHAAAFRDFCGKNQIDPADLSDFKLDFDGDWSGEYGRLYDRYPFEAYDEACARMPSFWEDLVHFVRENIEQF